MEYNKFRSNVPIVILIITYIISVYVFTHIYSDVNKDKYTFDNYEYSYDGRQWYSITKDELDKNVFYTDDIVYIKASLDYEEYETSDREKYIVVETNDVGSTATLKNQLIYNNLYKGSQQQVEFLKGSTSQIKIFEVENSVDLYNSGITFTFSPHDEDGYVKISVLSIFDDGEHIVELTKISRNKITLGVILITFGIIFLLTLASSIRNAYSLKYKYYTLGATSVVLGIFIIFVTNYYFIEQSQYYSFLVEIGFASLYLLIIPYALVLYNKLCKIYPNKIQKFDVIVIISYIVSIMLIFNIFTMTISNRVSNAIFVIYNSTIVIVGLVMTLSIFRRKLYKYRRVIYGEYLIEVIELITYLMLILGINQILKDRISITSSLVYFEIFLIFEFLALINYTLEIRNLTKASVETKERADKTNVLTNLMLDMMDELISVDDSDTGKALMEISNIANKFMPDLLYWESLILDLDLLKRKRLSVGQKMKLENALQHLLICSDFILDNDVVEVDVENTLITVGASCNYKNFIGSVIQENSPYIYQKLIGKMELTHDEYIIKSKHQRFEEVYIVLTGLSNFSEAHRNNIIKNYELIYESVENVLIQKEMKRNQQQVIYDLTTISESKSKETYNHVKRVVNYTEVLARGLGFSYEEIELVSIASAMHDIGKIATPFEILHKNGKLTQEEFEEIKKHTEDGYHILKVNEGELFHAAAIIARDHHEKYNGKGYRGISGEDIHIYARIVALADVFDALASDRAYKEAWPLDKVFNLILKESGQHFDPKIVEIFIDKFNEFLEIKRRYQD